MRACPRGFDLKLALGVLFRRHVPAPAFPRGRPCRSARADPCASGGSAGDARHRRARSQPDPVRAGCRRRPEGDVEGSSRPAEPAMAKRRSLDGGAGRVSGARGLHHALLVRDQGRDRKGRADLELRDGAGPRAHAHHRRSRLAACADRCADALAGGSARAPMACRRCAGGLCRCDGPGHRRHRDRDRQHRGEVEGQPEPARGRSRRRRGGPARRW